MPFTVITLKKVPNSLRGDLTRWMQEITTGVYVGSFNSKVREYLWERVTDTVGQGEAAMCYSCRNEIGYSFCTYNTERQVVDYDGIPLVLIPEKASSEPDTKAAGFSNASKFHHAMRKAGPKSTSNSRKGSTDKDPAGLFSATESAPKKEIVFLDLETTGLNAETDFIIEIGAVKLSKNTDIEFHKLIQLDRHIPEVIHKLTGISDKMLNEGSSLEESIHHFVPFIQDTVLVGYNIAFDIKFLSNALEKFSFEAIHNRTIDLMHVAKKMNPFQSNYKFETTLKEYGINQDVPHRALEDAKLVKQLYNRMGLGR